LFAVWLCLNFGLRRDEAVNLLVNNVDLRGKRLHITKSKTEKGKRTFPLQSEQIRILREYLSKRKGQELDHDYLIYSKRTRKPIEGGLLYNWIKSLTLEFSDNGYGLRYYFYF
jgi:integrase